jgi:hypothetical protein
VAESIIFLDAVVVVLLKENCESHCPQILAQLAKMPKFLGQTP